jgi:hypothetical protein
MSEYTKPCNTCKAEIRMSNNTGKWLPSNLDGSAHRCFGKKEETKKPLTMEELDLRLKVVESILLDPRPKRSNLVGKI